MDYRYPNARAKILIRLTLVFLVSLFFVLPGFFAPVMAVNNGTDTFSAKNPVSSNKQPVVEPDQSTGALIYHYDIVVPPGRNGMQPELKLQYNSQDPVQDSIFGFGWSLDIPSISRINKRGTDALFADNFFNSSLSGELVNSSGINYSSKIESGEFLKYTYSSDTWIALDKNDTTYTFGSQPSSRQDDPANPGKIYKWMLEKMQDANGNFISYSYYKDAGQLYPASITYTGNGSSVGIFSVLFTKESRPDIIQSSAPGFIVTTNYRISQIQTLINGTWSHKYVLGYASQSGLPRSLLSSVTESGQENSVVTTLPLTDFSYQSANAKGWTYDSSWQLPADQSNPGCTINGQPCPINLTSGLTQIGDINGDALPDIIQNNWNSQSDNDQWCGDHAGSCGNYILKKQYIYLSNGHGWVYDPSWQLPIDQGNSGCTIDGQPCPIDMNFNVGHLQLIDVNGDNLPDFVENNWNSLTNNDAWCGQNQGYCTDPIIKKQYIYLNTGHGWTHDASWQLPSDQNSGCTINGQPCPIDLSLLGGRFQIADINGDGLPDFIQRNQYIYVNNSHGWTYDASWQLPIDEGDSNCTTSGSPCLVNVSSDAIQIADINGDSLPDLIQNNWNNQSDTDSWCADHVRSCQSPIIKKQYIYVNNGHGWTYDASWQLPADQLYIEMTGIYGPHYTINGQPYPINLRNRGSIQISDVNGDNLPDLIQNNWNSMLTDQFCADHQGCPPFVKGQYIYLNTGHGWAYDLSWQLPVDQNNPSCTVNGQPCPINPLPSNNNIQLMDIDGNGSPDFVQNYWNPLLTDQFCADHQGCPEPRNKNQYIYINNAPKISLSSINIPTGGKIEIAYKSSAQSKDGNGNLLNPNLPFTIQAVNSITTTDTLTNILSQDNYTYANGYYYFNPIDPSTRKFAGFGAITKTDLTGTRVKNFYYQGNSSDSTHGEYQDDYWKIGRIYRSETTDSGGNVYEKNISRWDDVDLGSGSKFVTFLQRIIFAYDGDTTHRESAESYIYDNSNGNTIQKIQWGEVSGSDDGSFSDIGNDKFVTSLSYAAGGSISTMPSKSTVVDQNGIKVKENKFYYDLQNFGIVIKGNLTRQEDLKSGSNYVAIQKTYNAYGLPISFTDPLNNTTQYVYDAYNLYPATMTNAKSQSTQYAYNLSSGKMTQKIDPNTRVFQYQYDGLGRLVQEKQPDFAAPSILVVKNTYSYTDTKNVSSVKKVSYSDTTNSAESEIYFDSLGRKIQERQQSEGANFSVKDYFYDNRGLLSKESLPYFAPGPTMTSPAQDTTLYTNYVYDALGRLINSVNSVGATRNSYQDWKTTVIDANNKNKDFYKDTYGNMIQVDEHNSGSTYSTFYQYDYSGNVTRITDALGNVRNFTYDLLGQRIMAEDLHTPADSTFGIWTYSYDNAGNAIQAVDPKNQIVNYTYDSLGRQLTEDYTGTPGIEVTNTYDSGTDGVGQLIGVVNSFVSRSYVYNPMGLLKQETSIIDNVNYVTAYDYDRQGNQILITNPDNSQIKNIYNSAGLLDQVQRKESTDAGFSNLVNNFDYSPEGKVASQTDYNGIVTTNTYDSSKLYRLSKKATTIAGGVLGQSVAYNYDNVGNILSIADTSTTDSAKNSQYSYDDLYRLTSAAISNPATGQTSYNQTYAYDAIGNILNKSDMPGTYVYAGTAYANPYAVTNIGNSILSYDNNGNLLTSADGFTNIWDYKNRLISATKGSIVNTYSYDANGQRVKVVGPTSTTVYPTKFYNTVTVTTAQNATNSKAKPAADPSLIAYGKSDKAVNVAGSTIADSLGNKNNATAKGSAESDNLPQPYLLTKLDDVRIYNHALFQQEISNIHNSPVVSVVKAASPTTATSAIKHVFANGKAIATIQGTGTAAKIYYATDDYINSSSIMTDSAGALAETLDYFPFGGVRIDNRTGNLDEQRKYIGQEYDTDTSLNYLNARYYNSATGKFSSQDPMFWSFDKSWLADPQRLNSYSYANNNPITGSDPSGLLTIVIPGTFYDANAWNKGGSMDNFLSSVKNTFKDRMVVENNKDVWSGQDNDVARHNAASVIAKQINDYQFTEGEKLNIVGHSHGGNIANLVTGGTNHPVDNLVTLGTPAIDGYRVDRNNVKNQVNVYSWLDPIQEGGGNQLTTTGVAGYIAGGLVGGSVGSFIGGLMGNSLGWGQFGVAGKKVTGANNINVTGQALNPFTAHGAYFSQSVWSQVDEEVNK